MLIPKLQAKRHNWRRHIGRTGLVSVSTSATELKLHHIDLLAIFSHFSHDQYGGASAQLH